MVKIPDPKLQPHTYINNQFKRGYGPMQIVLQIAALESRKQGLPMQSEPV